MFLVSRVREAYDATGDNTEILLDATAVRLFLVPATMSLMGQANWWLPAWPDRLLPHLSLDSDGHAPARPELEGVAVLAGPASP